MQQSNAIRRLWEVLNRAVSQGKSNSPGGHVLLTAMQLEIQPKNFVDFYSLMEKAEEAIRTLEDPDINERIEMIEKLENYFITENVWASAWSSFADYVRQGNILLVLSSLAKELHNQHPMFLLERNYLEELTIEFELLLKDVISSNLSKELKQILKERIEEILSAIRNYHIGGTEGLRQSAQLLVSDLVMKQHNLTNEDKKNPTYTNVVGTFLALLTWVFPTPWDIIGAAPDACDFWLPRIEEIAQQRQQAEQIIRETSTIQEALEKLSKVCKEPQKRITGGKEPKALPAAEEEQKASTKDED